MSQNESNSPTILFNEWLAHPVTVRFRHLLQEQLEEIKTQWSRGAYTSESLEKSAMLNANMLGQCEVIELLLSLEANQLFPEQASE